MSSNPPKANTAQQASSASWGPTTQHRLGLRTIRRGRDRQWHFPEQQPDEVVRMVIRKHKWFLVRAALPLVGASAALFLFLAWFGPSEPSFQAIWSVLEILAGIAVVITGIYFLYKDLVVWFYETTIITDKRIINWGTRGSVLNPSRSETPLDKVQQISVDQDNLWEILLNYGIVHIYIVGGEIVLKDVPRPKMIRESLQGVHEDFKATKPPKEKTPLPENDPVMVALLEKLAKPEEVPSLPDADEKYTARHPERYRHKLRGPRRTFGGPLRIPCDVRYTSDEFTVEYIQRSPYVLVWRLALVVLLLAATIVAAFLVPSLFLIMSILVVLLLIAVGLIVINYVDDVYILTNKRIIDIQRHYIIFYEDRIEVEYKNIRDIFVNVPNVIEYALNIGDVHVQTPGNSPDIIFDGVANPFALQDKIYFLKDYKDKADKAKAKNERKEELYNWFGNVVTLLEKKATHKGVPDLQLLDFYTAAERARAFGMKVVFIGEDSSHPNLKPGVVVEQTPLPGTLLAEEIEDVNGKKKIPEIHVVLSRR